MNKRRKIIYLLLFWLLTGSSFNTFAEAPTDVPQALTLSTDTVIDGTLSVSSFQVSAGAEVLVEKDLVVLSQEDIIIDGSITGVEGNSTSTLSQTLPNQTDAASIILTTPAKIIINGTIQAANGIEGQNGGNIFLNAKEIILNNHLTAGNGGNGSGYGMDGGNGGSILIDGTLITPNNEIPVNIQAGNGGDGSESLPDQDGSNGGDGGDVILGDGTDGNPGAPGNDNFGSNGNNGPDGGRCSFGGSGGPGANVTGGTGGNGQNGGNASIPSGRGGNGGKGGKGGDAFGGRGGHGGNGGNCCNPDGPGGNGGHGAKGGNATGGSGGKGGNGGDGTLFGNGGQGGKGGDGGTGTGGDGGDGGNGGVGVPGGAAGLAAIGGTGTAGAGGQGGTGGNGGIFGSNGANGAAGVTGGAVSGNTGAGGAQGGTCSPSGFVDLTEFKAFPEDNGTLSLTWTTGTEFDNLEMNLWCTQLQGNWFDSITKLNSQPIFSKAILANYGGASYSSEDYPWVDTNLKPGIQHCTLEDFDANGQCTLHCDEISTVVVGNSNISTTELNELNVKAIALCNEYKPDGMCLEQLLVR